MALLASLGSCKMTINDCFQKAFTANDQSQEVCCAKYAKTEEERAECNQETEETKGDSASYEM